MADPVIHRPENHGKEETDSGGDRETLSKNVVKAK
jgi:hypothetical protein